MQTPSLNSAHSSVANTSGAGWVPTARNCGCAAALGLGIGPAGAWATAAPPVRVSAERSEAPDAHSAAMIAAGRAGPAAIALCEPLADGLQVCLRTKDGQGWRLVTEEDCTTWSTTAAALRAQALRDAAKAWAARPPTARTVDGMTGRYFLRQGDDAAEVLGLVEPARLATAAGTADVVVAMPERGTLLFWTPGAPDFDKVVAVGARRMAEAVADPLSASIYRHDGRRWQVWAEVHGEVEPRETAPAADPRPALPPGVQPR